LSRKRTSAWIPKLLGLLDAGNVFVAVGAGHLPDLITLLRRAGCSVAVVRG
jgi:uncharacterized protein YbaP (TraB family)